MLYYQLKAFTPKGCLLFYTKELPKVRDVIQVAETFDIDVELIVVEVSPKRKAKALQLINTKTYRDLGIMGQKCPMGVI